MPVQGKKAYYAIDAKTRGDVGGGDECVLSYDDGTWQRHVCPEN